MVGSAMVRGDAYPDQGFLTALAWDCKLTGELYGELR